MFQLHLPQKDLHIFPQNIWEPMVCLDKYIVFRHNTACTCWKISKLIAVLLHKKTSERRIYPRARTVYKTALFESSLKLTRCSSHNT
eukprot:c18529_g5_i1 orf=146-406(+)